MNKDESSIEESSDDDDLCDFSAQMDVIYQKLHQVCSSLGYISKIVYSSQNPTDISVEIHGNSINNSLSYLNFDIVIFKNSDERLPYKFYAQFFVVPFKNKSKFGNKSEDNLKYIFGALSVDRLIDHVREGIQNIEKDYLTLK